MLTREEDVDAHALRRQGWTISAIARHLDRDRKTIRAYLNGEQVPGQRRQNADAFAPAALRNCPHCDQPVTIVALLATPEAARPTIPKRVPDITPLRRIP